MYLGDWPRQSIYDLVVCDRKFSDTMQVSSSGYCAKCVCYDVYIPKHICDFRPPVELVDDYSHPGIWKVGNWNI